MKILFRNLILFFIFIIFITGCSQKLTLPSQSIIEEAKFDISSNSIEENIVICDDGRIFLKTDGRSIMSILDEIAFKKRINYSIYTSIPSKRLNTLNDGKGSEFSDINQLLNALKEFMNSDCPDCYDIQRTADGIRIIGSEDRFENSYKKVFLFNTTVEETKNYLDDFFKNTDNKYSIISITSQNALLVKGDKEILNQITDVIDSLDSSYMQVMIESQVFEYDDTISRKIGTALEYGKINGDFNYGIKTEFGEGITSNLPTYFGSLTDAAKKQTLLFNLAMEDKNGGVKVIAQPRVVMKPGQEGSIKLNTVKYVIAAGVNIAELKEMKTGVVFKITPTILSKDKIQLKIFLEQSEFIPIQEQDIVQSINQNIIESTIIVNDNELISIGGIYLSKESDFNSGIPYLKDIPLIGNLFGSTSSDKSRVMIEFIIKPTIKNLKKELNNKIEKVIKIQNEQHIIDGTN